MLALNLQPQILLALSWEDLSFPNVSLGMFLLLLAAGLVLLASWLTLRYIPNDSVGIVEKLWSAKGSVAAGRIIALHGEAGYQAEVLRGGVHFGYWRWQFLIHRMPLVTIRQGKIGYVYARDGEALLPTQTLAQIVPCQNFQDARSFLAVPSKNQTAVGVPGQRGRQRAILREGVYAINTALFIVMTQENVFALRTGDRKHELAMMAAWQKELQDIQGFDPIVVGGQLVAVDPINPEETIAIDSIGIVTVHDGASLQPGEIIAPTVGTDVHAADYHNNFQDPEAFLRAGGQRGRQYQPLTDGTYFINRWFATVELIPKTLVPIGYVGVVVSYHGRVGKDVSGDSFRHGERVGEGERGVLEVPLGPGKYAFNTYAGSIVMVPTTNFVLHWITGRSETHRYDENLRSIDLVTHDAYEPLLPLSVVVHIDYQRAPGVIQRFGDVKKLITQTLDPMLSAYFRDVAHRKTMLELLHERDVIQQEARDELRKRFHAFDIECVDVLIGKPQTAEKDNKIETLLEQLRQRQLSFEQLETYERQRVAADKLRTLNEAKAHAEMQTQMTNAALQVKISESQGEADLAKSRKVAEQTVVVAEAELARSRRQAEQTVVLAKADAERATLAGRGESQRILQAGLSEAAVLQRRISSYGDPRLYAMSVAADSLSRSTQPLVPERMVLSQAGGDGQGSPNNLGLLGLLLQILIGEKSGVSVGDSPEMQQLKDLADRMTSEVLKNVPSGSPVSATEPQKT